MARLLTSGFEIFVAQTGTGVGSPDGAASSTPICTRVTTGQRSGAACLRINATAALGNVQFDVTGVLDRGYWARFYLKIVSAPASPPRAVAIFGSGSVSFQSTGGLTHSYATGSISASVNDGAWHRVEVYLKASATQASRAWEFRVDGATVSSGTAQTGDSAAPTSFIVGTTGTFTTDLYYDDVAVNDDQGSTQNSWPDDGYVICLLPTADNSRGSWTGGAGGTTNLWDALNNTPPVGAVAPGTNTSQISANAVATTGKFDTQAYTAAGATAGHTAVGCSVVACTGEQAATGTKSGSASTDTAVNNSPTTDTGSLAYGLDAGTEGAWPNLWRYWASPFTAYASQPTLSSGARLNIVTTTTSRVADCCFLGLYVEMQPSVAAAVIPDLAMALAVT